MKGDIRQRAFLKGPYERKKEKKKDKCALSGLGLLGPTPLSLALKHLMTGPPMLPGLAHPDVGVISSCGLTTCKIRVRVRSN